ncbi:hypothetical protein HU200_025796 [Digitaria exilis]|uniref:Uncharacterized protein n=1 Tax=Digitaria exilis TaxID=1010633 RepID=A0A835C4G0_9POAL|nr:hypothetical protein HU200_025796 [Digitaria exilis]CAB3501934.1 unnamed protein product [Digitaria exilis]
MSEGGTHLPYPHSFLLHYPHDVVSARAVNGDHTAANLSDPTPQVVVVTSGKGGVGKTTTTPPTSSSPSRASHSPLSSPALRNIDLMVHVLSDFQRALELPPGSSAAPSGRDSSGASGTIGQVQGSGGGAQVADAGIVGPHRARGPDLRHRRHEEGMRKKRGREKKAHGTHPDVWDPHGPKLERKTLKFLALSSFMNHQSCVAAVRPKHTEFFSISFARVLDGFRVGSGVIPPPKMQSRYQEEVTNDLAMRNYLRRFAATLDLHRINMSRFFAQRSSLTLPRPNMTLYAPSSERCCGTMHFMLLGRERQGARHGPDGPRLRLRRGAHALRTAPNLSTDLLYVLDSPQEVAVGEGEHCFEAITYERVHAALPPDRYLAPIHSTHPLGAWIKKGDWTLPFQGLAHYVPEYKLCHLLSFLGVLEDIGLSKKPLPVASFVVHLGSTRFCIARLFWMDDDDRGEMLAVFVW